ncbi:MAG: SGNH/GDSL hydrolase family protein [Candidatus Cryptobacteroides sp.]
MKINFFAVAAALLLGSLSMASAQDWANFERYSNDNKNVAVKPTAVLMGDSITDLWYATRPDFFTGHNFAGRGISGQTTSQMLVRFRRDVIDLHPKYVVILAGTNDIARNTGIISLENILGNIISMCELARANGIKPVICSVLPASAYGWRPEVTDSAAQIAELNRMLSDYAASKRIKYVDYHAAMKNDEGGLPKSLAADGVHPTADGYVIMESMLLEALR